MKTKRLFLMILVLAMAVFAFALHASAAEVANGTCGDSLTWTLDDTGLLTVTGTGAMKNGQMSNSSPFYGQRANIKSVVIGEGVTSIGDYAFQSCAALESVVLPSTLESIGSRAFQGCAALRSLEIPGKVTSIGSYAFENCDGLTSLTIPDSVQTLGYGMISYCDNLTALSLGCGVRDAYGSSFYMCDTLETVTVAPENVYLTVQNGILFTKDMTRLIYCPPMNPVGDYTVPESVTQIGVFAFYNSKNLTGVTLGSNVTALGGNVFSGCKSLTNVMLPDTLTELPESAFAYCTALKEIALPKALTTLGSYSFNGSGLESVTIPEGVTRLPNSVFSSCKALTKVEFPKSLTYIDWYAFQYCDGLKELSFPDTVTKITDSAFAYCENLEKVTLPTGLTALGSSAFFSCDKLSSVIFRGNAPTSFASSAFMYINSSAVLKYPYCARGWSEAKRNAYCDDYTWEGYLPSEIAGGSFGNGLNWLFSSDGTLVLTGSGSTGNFTISGAVTTAPWRSYARQIKKVWIDEGITDLGNYLFYGCSALETVEFAGNPPSIGAAAFSAVNCTVRYFADNSRWTPEEEGQFGGTLTWKPMGQTEDYIAKGETFDIIWILDNDGVLKASTPYGDMPDYGSTSAPWSAYKNHIKTVDLRNAKGVGSYAFYGCSYLTKVIMPTEMSCGVGNYAFYNCDALKEVFFPADTSYMLGQYSFANCDSLEKISLSGRATLSAGTFSGCSKLSEIYFNDKAVFNNDNFARTDTFSGVTATVYYPVDGGPYYTSIPTYGGTLSWKEVSYGVCGPDARWEYDETTKTLTINGSGSLAWYSAGHFSPWYAFAKEIVTIIVGDGITDIPRYAFEFCEAAETVILPDTLKSLSISAFRKCLKLNDMLLPNGLEEFTESNYAFNTCPALTDLYYFGTEEEWDKIPNSGNVYNAADGFSMHYLVLHEVSPTCTEPGIKPYYQFDKTDRYADYYDDNRNLITAPVPAPALDHDWKDATCTDPKSCGRCFATEGERLGHQFEDGACVHACGALSAKITKQPVSVTVAEGTTAKVTVSATGDGLKYQWYIKNSGSSYWGKSSITTDTYTVKMANSVKDRQIYCVITDQYGNSIKSDTVLLSMTSNLSIIKQPADASVYAGGTVNVAVSAVGDTLEYQWYVKNLGSPYWGKSSVTTDTYTVKMTDNVDGRQIYCVITDEYDHSVKTNTVTLSMLSALEITTQPQNTFTKLGATASVKVNASGDGLTYTWYVKNSGTAYWGRSSVTSSTYSVKMSASTKDRQIYCVVKDKYGNMVKTNTVSLYMAATITDQPQTSYIKLGAASAVEVKAVGDDLTYTWYVKNAGASFWGKSSVTESTYTVNMSATSKDRQIYCVVKDKYGNTAKTDTVLLRMAVTLTEKPCSVVAPIGSTAEVEVNAVGDGLTYTWYVKNAGVSYWGKSSVTSNIYAVKMSENSNGRQIYCVVSDMYGNTVKTETVYLRVK